MAIGSRGSLSSMQQMAQLTSQMKTDWAQIVKSAQQFNSAVAGSAGVTQQANATVNPAAPGTNQTTAQGAGATGYGKDQGLRLGPIARAYVTGGMGGAIGMTAVVGGTKAVGFAGNVGLSMINDFRPGREQTLDFELSRQIARMGTGDYTRFKDNLSSAMNDFNVQNRAVIERDVAISLNQGYAAMMAGNSMAGKEQSAAQLVGSMHSLTAMAGMTAEQSMAAQSSIYSAQGYYSALASGVMTRNPTTGDMLSPEQIINQYRRTIPGLANASPEELARALAPGSGLRLQLEQTFGAEGAEVIMTGLRATTEAGRGLRTGETVDELAKSVGMVGTKYTQGRDSESKRQRSEQEVIMEYAEDVTNGIRTANEILTSINDHIARQTGWLRDVYGAIATAGGLMDTMNVGAQQTTKTVVDGIGNMLSSIGPLISGAVAAGMVSKAAGGQGLPLPLPHVLGGRGTGLKAMGWKGALKLGAKGLGRLGLAGLVATGGLMATDWAADKSSGPTEDFGIGDAVGNTLGKAGSLALAGFALTGNPWVALGGGIAGLGYGIWDSFQREANDLERPPGYSQGSWFVEKDQTADIHQGEMILPNRVAEAVRTELRHGTGRSAMASGGRSNVVINLTIQRATDQEAMLFAQRVRRYMDEDDELMRAGAGSLSLMGAVR